MKDEVFNYLKTICKDKDLVLEHEEGFKNIVLRLTNGKDLRFDFTMLFTYAIFWQQSTLRIADRLQNEFLPKWIKKNCNYTDIPRDILEWIKIDLQYSSKSAKKIAKGIKEFIAFIRQTDPTNLKTPKGFERELEKYFDESISEIKKGLMEFSNMGEKTSGLFLKTLGYYTRIRNLNGWKTYKFPTFGITEVYIWRFIQEIYEYYGNKAFKEGLFDSFILNSPVSIDIIRAAYVKGRTFNNFIPRK